MNAILRTSGSRWPWLLCLVLAVGLTGCGAGDDGNDGGNNGGDDDPGQCTVDDSRVRPTMDPNWEITPGDAASTGHICPRTDVDHYWFTIGQPATIVTVELTYNVPLGPRIQPCYRLLPESDADPVVANECDYDNQGLIQRHYLQEAGNYFLEVSDASNDEEDPTNPYAVSVEQVADPDLNEANNDKDHPTALASASDGYISFQGDQDWFAVQVGAPDQIMRIDLTNAEASPVDLRYTLFASDGTSPINTSVDANGMDGATAISDVLAIQTQGTYYLVVTDEGNDDSDLEVGYHVAVSIQQNPDSRDRGGNNDLPQNATPISSGTPIGDAYLATRADQDWYRIEKAGVSDSNPALIEIDVQVNGSSPVDPAVDLIVGDPNTACNQGDACEVLSWTCGADGSVELANAQCPSHECLVHEGRCRGAGFCLPEGGCGIRHLVMHGADWSTSGSPRHLHTVAPMFGSVYYILVRDFQGDDLDPDNSYTITVTTRDEPDANEFPPNGQYQPYATDEAEDDSRNWNIGMATPVPCTDVGGVIECGPLQGYLSYRGDQDWYVFQSIPAEDEPVPEDQSLKVDYDLQFDYSFAGSADLYINYGFWLGNANGQPHAAFNHLGPESGTMGDDECIYLCGEYQSGRPIYLRVQHSDRKKWDYNQPYNLTVRANRECPQVCEWCRPDVVDYACPNPGNPCPGGDCQ